MKYFLFVLFTWAYSNLQAQTSNYQEEFIAAYQAQALKEGEELSVDKMEKLIEKDKLDLARTLKVYSSSFGYKDVDANLRALLLAYIYENELKQVHYYKNSENILLQSAYEIFTARWNDFAKGRKLKDDEIKNFIVAESLRLEKLGIDLNMLEGLLN
ncbi:MAG: hypothetical protein R2772_02790 [Chitinophagales bacterium]